MDDDRPDDTDGSARDPEGRPPGDDFDPSVFLFREMTGADWSALLRELGAFAAGRVARFRWNGLPPSPHDLVMGAVEEVLSDPSRWKPERRRRRLPPGQCLRKYLFDVIWGDLRHLHERMEERTREDALDEHGRCRLDASPSSARSPEEFMEDRERADRIRQIGAFARSRGYGLEFWLYWVLELKPREIAERLEVPPPRIWSRLQLLKQLIARNFGPQFSSDAEDDEDDASAAAR